MRPHNEHNRDAFSLSSTRPTRQPEDGEDSLTLPAIGPGISPHLAKLLEQRGRLKVEIVRLLAPFKDGYPRVPDAIRIDPRDALPQFLQSGCAEFYRAETHGEDCLWATGAWWDDLGDKKRYEIARQYAIDECATPDATSWQRAEDIRIDLSDLEYEIANTEISTLPELRVLANVVNEQFLSGRTIFGAIPYSFVANVLRVIGAADSIENGGAQ